MRGIVLLFGLLGSLATSNAVEDCDPDAPYVPEPYDGETSDDPATLRHLREYLEDYSCYKLSDGSELNMKEQCKNVCAEGEDNGEGGAVISSQSCNFRGAPWIDAETEKPLLCGKDKTFKGLMFKKGYCVCDSPALAIAGNFFIEAVAEAGKILDKVVCPLLKALDIVVAIGMAAVPPPGKFITTGMGAAVRSAKLYRYAYEAKDAAEEWADFLLGGLDFSGQAGCGAVIPAKQDLIKKAFESFVDAPDDTLPDGISYGDVPCPAGGCRGCKGARCKDDNNDKKSDTSKSNAFPSSTKDNDLSTSLTSPGSDSEPTQTTEKDGSKSSSPTNTPFIRSSTLSTMWNSSAIATSTLDCKALASLASAKKTS